MWFCMHTSFLKMLQWYSCTFAGFYKAWHSLEEDGGGWVISLQSPTNECSLSCLDGHQSKYCQQVAQTNSIMFVAVRPQSNWQLSWKQANWPPHSGSSADLALQARQASYWLSGIPDTSFGTTRSSLPIHAPLWLCAGCFHWDDVLGRKWSCAGGTEQLPGCSCDLSLRTVASSGSCAPRTSAQPIWRAFQEEGSSSWTGGVSCRIRC